MRKLEAFCKEDNEIKKNRMLFDWLRDDQERAQLYAELRDKGFPVLQFKSLLRSSPALAAPCMINRPIKRRTSDS